MHPWLKALIIPVLAGGLTTGVCGQPTRPAQTLPDPIHIETFSYHDNQLPNNQALNLITGQLIVKNTGKTAVQGVDLIVHIQDRDHNDLAVEKQPIGILPAGESYIYNWDWRNYSSFTVAPVAEVRHFAIGHRLVSVMSGPTSGQPAARPTAGLGATPGYNSTPSGLGTSLATYRFPLTDLNPPGYNLAPSNQGINPLTAVPTGTSPSNGLIDPATGEPSGVNPTNTPPTFNTGQQPETP